MNPLDQLMRDSGLNATQIAKLAGCTPETVRRWRCGIRQIPPRRLEALALWIDTLPNNPRDGFSGIAPTIASVRSLF